MIATHMKKLLHYLGLMRNARRVSQSRQTAGTSAQADYSAMSPVQRSTARAARKNPWILAG
jgi:hypothetical protein